MKRPWDEFLVACGVVVITFLMVLAIVMQHQYGRPYRASGFDSDGRVYYEYTD